MAVTALYFMHVCMYVLFSAVKKATCATLPVTLAMSYPEQWGSLSAVVIWRERGAFFGRL